MWSMTVCNQRKYVASWLTRALAGLLLVTALSILAGLPFAPRSHAQEPPAQPGEAYVTRFSGTLTQGGRTIIDTTGTVGSLVDVRQPGDAARGRHWLDEPQRQSVTAAEVGQVFGIAFDDATPANIYLSATSAFGLHRTAEKAGWMAGMWGANGGPGTVYRLDAANSYKPGIFATITLGGRANTGAALGNIAYDRWNRQLYVSDLETGMIHRLAISDGRDLGQYDHGTQGRASFTDATTGVRWSVPAVAFDATAKARTKDCPGGNFAETPECWNLADFRRRVWGLGVRKDTSSGEIRLYYAVWSSQGLGNEAWFEAADDESNDQSNSLWSVKIAADGSFDTDSVRREFFLPDFFRHPGIADHGPSHPVSDIAFAGSGSPDVMLLAERGGVRNLGLGKENAFASPHEARVLRYELDGSGIWRLKGRYDVGFYDRKKEGLPYLRANGAGGVDFGYGYTQSGVANLSQPDKTVWMTGDALCSPDGKCLDPGTGQYSDASQVHGLQGTPEESYGEEMPDGAALPYPGTGAPYPATGPEKSILIDTDIDVDAAGKPTKSRLVRNDATRIGDVEVYAPPAGAPPDTPSIVTPGIAPPPSPGGQGPSGPDLRIGKVHSGAPCAIGATCAYIITVTNAGNVPFAGPLYISDTMPQGASFASSLPPWSCAASGQDLDCYHAPLTLAPGASISLSIMLSLPAAMKAHKVITNCASIRWMMQAPPNNIVFERALTLAGYNTGPVDGVIDAQAKAAILQYQKDHALAQTGQIDDILRNSLFGGAAGGGDVNPGNDSICIPTALAGAGPGGGSGGAGGPKPAGLDLKLEKTGKAECDPTHPPGCGFEIIGRNTGTVVFKGPLTITDKLPKGWKLGAFNPGWKCTQSGDVVTCSAPGPFNVLPGKTIRLGINFKTSTNATNLPKQWENCASIDWSKGGGPDVDPSNDRDCATVKIKVDKTGKPWGADIKIEKQGPAECTLGGMCVFTIKMSNEGSVPYPDSPSTLLIITDDLPKGWTMVSYSPGSPKWNCHGTGAQVSCSYKGKQLQPNDSASVTITARVALNSAGNEVENCATVSIHQFTGQLGGTVIKDDNPGNDRGCARVKLKKISQLKGAPDLQLYKFAPKECAAGSWCIFTLMVKNIGLDTYKGKGGFKVTDVLPSNWKLIGSGCFLSGGNQVECALSRDLISGETYKFEISTRIPANHHEGPQKNKAHIVHAPGSGDTNPANDYAESTTVVTKAGPPTKRPRPDLKMTKMAPAECRRDRDCRFTVVITNVGDENYKGMLSYLDEVPAGTKPSQSTKNKCTKFDKDRIECKLREQFASNDFVTLRPGDSLVREVYLSVPSSYAKNVVKNCASIRKWKVIKFAEDINQTNDRDCATAKLIKLKGYDLEVRKRVLPTANSAYGYGCAPGKTCQFGIQISNNKNNTNQDYNGILSVRDTLPKGWTFEKLMPLSAKIWSCAGQGGMVTCKSKKPLTLKDNSKSLWTGSDYAPEIDLIAKVPQGHKAGLVENCAEVI
ncbi:MAG TPA: DUF11 domain-containing protein, partial [Rhizobiales bacterium]|nr:DUF11 domain-containing protein [Hyphomicrobiales bacterium]